MFLNKLPTFNTPKPIIFGAAIFLAVFYFWFTQPAEDDCATDGPSTSARGKPQKR